jgi:hypothetical protein
VIQSRQMKRVFVLVALALFVCADSAAGQTRPGPVRMAAFIPRTAGPWLSEADQIFNPVTVSGHLDGSGEIYLSYNMKVLVSRRFHKDGRPDIAVDLSDMGTSDDAFGLFTYDLNGEDASIGQGSIYKAGLLTFWKDRYFCSVSTEEETAETKAVVLDLGRAIAGAIPKGGSTPKLMRDLPPEGLEAGRIRYFHDLAVLNHHFFVADKDILLLDRTASAVLASYATEGGRSYLLVIAYPDEAKAVEAFDSFGKSYTPDAKKSGIVRTQDRKWTASARAGAIVIVVLNAGSDQFAMSQLASVQELIETDNKK